MCERLKEGRIISLIRAGHREGGQGGKRSEVTKNITVEKRPVERIVQK